ncbi:Proctolin precursor [Daphnia sinensis]|uniref:Proctolin n=1 Tax=Daphnia sinensis TaxID=1820382 RepID=A0AAD5KMM8_9CRUS|nr:Proctolin precursor [Daphnia sinensis]
MVRSISLKVLLVVVVVSSILMASSSSSSWGVDARYLPTRSDSRSPIGPPRGEDPRFDRFYDIVRQLFRDGGGDMMDEAKYQIQSQLNSGQY